MTDLAQLIRGGGLARPADAQAIRFKGRWWTWGDLNAIAAGLAAAFEEFGLPVGAQIGCILRNRPEHCGMMIGVAAAERCVVTFNGLLPDDKLVEDLQAARPPMILASADDWARPALRNAAAQIGAAGISVGDGAMPIQVVEGLERIGEGAHGAPMPEIAILMLTSGTTGKPKRVPLKASVIQRQLAEAALAAAPIGPGQADQPRAASPPSLMHGSIVHIGGVWGVLGAGMSGRAFVLSEKFSVQEWRDQVVEFRPKAVGGPPAALRMILDANLPKEDLASLVSVGAGTARVDPEIVDEFLARYDLPVLTNYGATEFAGGVASWSLKAFRQYWTAKRGAVGRIHRTVEAQVVDPETGQVLAFGEEGILELKGYQVGDGESWTRTTDRAVLDEDRFLWIKGRLDNAINRGGFKVHPDEVCEVLERHPAVREASVVGMPDRRLGEVPVAAVILKQGAGASEAGLVAWVREHLMAYCVPTAVKIVEELPRTPSMKVSAPAVRELFAVEHP